MLSQQKDKTQVTEAASYKAEWAKKTEKRSASKLWVLQASVYNSGQGGKLERAGKTVYGQFSEEEEKVITCGEKSMEERLLQSLKNHELPDYFLYTGMWGAKNWLKLDGSGTFPVARKLKDLLEKYRPKDRLPQPPPAGRRDPAFRGRRGS